MPPPGMGAPNLPANSCPPFPWGNSSCFPEYILKFLRGQKEYLLQLCHIQFHLIFSHEAFSCDQEEQRRTHRLLMILEDFSVCLSHSTVPGKLCFLKALCAQPSSCPGSCTGFPAKCCSLLAWSRRAALQKGTYRPQKLTHTAIPAHFVLLYIST